MPLCTYQDCNLDKKKKEAHFTYKPKSHQELKISHLTKYHLHLEIKKFIPVPYIIQERCECSCFNYRWILTRVNSTAASFLHHYARYHIIEMIYIYTAYIIFIKMMWFWRDRIPARLCANIFAHHEIKPIWS
jgi:hypothetical protein